MEISYLINEVNKIADRLASQYHSNLGEVHVQNVSGDMMKILDDKANNELLNFLSSLNRSHPLVVVSEETGVDFYSRSPEYFVFIDPIDGSNNVRNHFTPSPTIGLSIGIGTIKNLETYRDYRAFSHTITRDIFKNELYLSDAFGPSRFVSQLASCRIKVAEERVDVPVVGIDLDCRTEVDVSTKDFLKQGVIQRRLGSSILDFCQVACGQYDGYVSNQGRLKITDIAQSHHLISRCGGTFITKCLIDGIMNKQLNETYMLDVLNDHSLLKRSRFKVATASEPQLLKQLEYLIEG